MGGIAIVEDIDSLIEGIEKRRKTVIGCVWRN